MPIILPTAAITSHITSIYIMAPQDSVGRIHKVAFVGSTSAMFALAMLAVVLRLSYRITRNQFAIDDAILVFGTITLLAAFIIMYDRILNDMYLVRALEDQMPDVIPPGNPPGNMQALLRLTNDFHNWGTAMFMLNWSSILAAKFTFLAFFWKLIDRIEKLKMYWWVAFVLNVVFCVYGMPVYILSCPYFNDPERIMQCNNGPNRPLVLVYSFTQMSVDIVGDLLILILPITIVWKIRIRPAQKLILLLCLSLTIFMIIITVVRVSGVVHKGIFDIIWQMYWLLLGGEVGIFMAAAVAFRTFFVARSQSRDATPPEHRRFFKSATRRQFQNWDGISLDSEDKNILPSIPSAQLTGIRNFIYEQGSGEFRPTM